MRFLSRLLLLTLVLIGGYGCSNEAKIESSANVAAYSLFKSGRNAMNAGNHVIAIRQFQRLLLQYPFGPFARQAELDLLNSYVEASRIESAISLAERIVREHPTHPNLDYVFYMQGLANYNLDFGFLQQIVASPVTKRDTSHLKLAYQAFYELVTRYPKSRYANDAYQRILHIRELLAESELHIARYYYDRKAFVAAHNRYQRILYEYPQTKASLNAHKQLEKTKKKLTKLGLI